MAQTRIEHTKEFEFIKNFVGKYGMVEPDRLPVGSSETTNYLYSVGKGAGRSNRERAFLFMREVCTSILDMYRNKMNVIQCDLSDRNDPRSLEQLKTYFEFNPGVVAAYVDDSEGPERSLLKVLLRDNLTEQEIQNLVLSAENWRDFFFRVSREFDSSKVYDFYPSCSLVLAVEDIALKVDPTLERDYKDTGIARLEHPEDEEVTLRRKWQSDGSVMIYPHVPRSKLIADGVKRISHISKVPLENVIGDELKRGLDGKRVDFHVGGSTITNWKVSYSGTLLRILD